MNPGSQAALRSIRRCLTPALTAALLCGCVSVVHGRSVAGNDRTPLHFGPDVSAERLDSLLLDPTTANRMLGGTSLVIDRSYGAEILENDDDTSSDPVCEGAIWNTIDATYQGTDFVAMRGQLLVDSASGTDLGVDQAVVAFATGAKARAFLEAALDTWHRCAGRTVTFTPAETGDAQQWKLRNPSKTHGLDMVVSHMEGGEGYGCTHAITARANVIVDVAVCRNPVGGEAADVVDAIADRFPQ